MSKPTHYPLTMDEFLKLNTLLTDAELRIYLYLMIKNPFPDSKIEIDTALISEQLGLTRRTVQRSIKRLSELQLIEIEITRFKYKKATHGASSKLGGAVVNDDIRIANDDIRIANDDIRIANDDIRIANDDIRIANDDTKIVSSDTRIADTHLKPLPDKASSTPQTIQTYTDFIHTLSDSEREIFLEFGREKAANLPHPPELPDKWIAANFTEIYKYFLASSAGREAKQEAIARKYDWENDPRLMDWLHKAYWEGHPWAIADEFEREERLAFLMWAQKTNAYAGRIADEPA